MYAILTGRPWLASTKLASNAGLTTSPRLDLSWNKVLFIQLNFVLNNVRNTLLLDSSGGQPLSFKTLFLLAGTHFAHLLEKNTFQRRRYSLASLVLTFGTYRA